MNFWQRLRFFLIGFVPGTIILIFIINKKGCSSPNELKMLELSHQHLELGDKAKCKLKCLILTQKGFQVTMQDMKINYDLSEVRKKPYGVYFLEYADKSKAKYELLAIDKDTVTYIDDIKLLNNLNCFCDTLN
jgi:hypothetical protein